MALNNISFNLGQGGIGRQLPGEDYISGMLFYGATLPSGFTTSNRIKQFFSLQDAVTAGIVGNYSDETKATGSYLITTPGTVGDVVSLYVAEPFGVSVFLGSYTKTATESTAALVAAAIVAAINARTLIHGYVASLSTATVVITARPGLGVFLNTGTPLSTVLSAGATLAGTLTQFTGGVASVFATWYYHISEFFRLQPKGNLFVGIYAVPGSYTYTEITTMQNYANGKIRQFGIFKGAIYVSGEVTTIHNVCASLVTSHKETIALYAADISATPDVSTLTDLSTLSANLCSVVIGQDGAALGAQLFYATSKSVTTLGATLGTISSAKVSQSIAWVGKFNISNGVECDTIAFANGVLFSNSSITDTYLSTLQNMRYIFLRKFVGIAGSFFNENSTSIALSSNYAYIADNRTIQKATRGIYASLIPALNSPITLNSDGTLANESIAYFQGLAELPLLQMIRDSDLSGMSVSINASQNILATGILLVNVSLVQIATGRNIQVNIGYQVTV